MNMTMISMTHSTPSSSSIFGVMRHVEIEDYKWVALVASLMMFHIFVTGFIPGSIRGKIFTQKFMEDNFLKEHEENFPKGTMQGKLNKEGYPDMGSGHYSEKLQYKDWYRFNAAQRVHYHYLESVTCVVCWLLIAGLLHPWVAVAFGAAYIIGRILFTIGYMTKGPRGRWIGFLTCQISATVLFVFSFVSPIQMAVTWND